jgi:large subunit ribosomal protein L23
MGIFGKKDTPKDATTEAKVVTPKVTKVSPVHVASVIIKPRITEKAALLTDKNVYTFEVKKGATKYEVRDAIKALYNVTPVKVNIVTKEPRHYMSRSRGRGMMEHGMRKAYVYLKKGDRIELV